MTWLITAALWLASALLAIRSTCSTPATAAHSGGGVFADFLDGLAEARRHRWFLGGLSALVVWLALGEASIRRQRRDVQRRRLRPSSSGSGRTGRPPVRRSSLLSAGALIGS